jgi:AraC-like DNA-binding protein
MVEPGVFGVVDPLGEALHFLRMTGTFYTRSELTGPWGVELPPITDCLMFHVVTTGRCWLTVADVPPRLLVPGELALVPHGAGHRLASERDARTDKLFDLPHDYVSERYAIVRHGGGGAPTSLICGAFRFEHPAARRLVSLLPRSMVVTAQSSPASASMQGVLELMAAEAQALRPGGEAVITRLADVLVIQAIRAWLDEVPRSDQGWLGAMQDGQIGRAIAEIHRDPARPWTVASLADVVGMSRSAFAARFTEFVGEPVMQYVARWRMHVASTWLKEDDAALAELASRLGYQSEAAFSRAFKRFTGVSPGAVRRAAFGRSGRAPALAS